MPVTVTDNLPAIKALAEENIFIMPSSRAVAQDIRPLKIAVLNLMPTKVVTETQLLRLLGNTPLQIEITLLHPKSHVSKNTPEEHLSAFYRTFDEISHEKFDGLIITGAPVENMPFEEVNYWEELKHIMDWAASNVFSTLYICWAAQAGLYYKYGIEKYPLEKKCSGIFEHSVLDRSVPLVRGFDSVFYAPHSRHTQVLANDIERIPSLKLVSVSKEAGVYLVISSDKKHIFVTGHSEYEVDTLRIEYLRDVRRGMDPPLPANYFPQNDPGREPQVTWRAHSNLLFQNWLNYYVYQETPYDISKI